MDSSLVVSVLGLLLVILSVAMFFLASGYSRMMAQLEELKSREHREREDAHHKASRIVDEAREKSLEMIEETGEKAKDILRETEYVSDSTKATLQSQLKHATTEQATEYTKMLTAVRQEAIKLFEALSQELQAEAKQELKNFQQQIESQNKQIGDTVTAEIKNAYSQATAGAEAYRQELMKKADATFFPFIKELTYSTIGKTLTKAEHEAVVLKSLEEAKKQGVLK